MPSFLLIFIAYCCIATSNLHNMFWASTYNNNFSVHFELKLNVRSEGDCCSWGCFNNFCIYIKSYENFSRILPDVIKNYISIEVTLVWHPLNSQTHTHTHKSLSPLSIPLHVIYEHIHIHLIWFVSHMRDIVWWNCIISSFAYIIIIMISYVHAKWTSNLSLFSAWFYRFLNFFLLLSLSSEWVVLSHFCVGGKKL